MVIIGKCHCGNIVEAVDASLLQRVPAGFEGEGEGSRLGRRKRNWIARVEFKQALP
jgi:hypothetical protein